MIRIIDPPDKWEVQVFGRTREGKQRRRRRVIKGSKISAQRLERELIEELAAIRNGYEHSGATFGEFLTKEFFPSVSENSEYHNLTCSMRKWCRSIWNLKLQTINPVDIREILNRMGESCSISTVRKMRSFLFRSFKLSQEGGLKENPVRDVKLDNKKVKKFEPAILTKTEIKKLLFYTKQHFPDTYYPIFAMAIYTGARSGEMYSWIKSDCDLQAKTITISKSWSRSKGVKGTKNGKTRIIPIAEAILPLVRTLCVGRKDAPLLPRPWQWTKGILASELRKICHSIGINKPMRVHDLRANFICAMLQANVDVLTVMQLVSHSSIDTTNRYVNLSGVNVRGATDALDNFLPIEREDIKKVINFNSN